MHLWRHLQSTQHHLAHLVHLQRHPLVSLLLLAHLNLANSLEIPMRRSSVRAGWWTTGLCLMGTSPVLSLTVNVRLRRRHQQLLCR
jgi:hypothetical protein